MKLTNIDYGTYKLTFDSTGRTLHVWDGIIGITLDNDHLVFAGGDTDNGVYITDENGKPTNYFKTAESLELADYMIDLWKKWKEE